MIEMYWITRLCALNELTTIVMVISGFVCSVSFIGYLINKDNGNDEVAAKFSKYLKRVFCVLCVTTLLQVFIPSKRDFMLIIGGGAIYEYVQNSEEVKKLPDNVVKALNDWLEDDKEK